MIDECGMGLKIIGQKRGIGVEVWAFMKSMERTIKWGGKGEGGSNEGMG